MCKDKKVKGGEREQKQQVRFLKPDVELAGVPGSGLSHPQK